jgi:hypothetical protein
MKDVERKEVTRYNHGPFEVYLLKKSVQDEILFPDATCEICGSTGLLDARIRAGIEGAEIGKLHFICGLFSKRFSLLDLPSRTFEPTSASINSPTLSCCFCGRESQGDLLVCEYANCGQAAHMYCGLLARKETIVATKSNEGPKDDASQGKWYFGLKPVPLRSDGFLDALEVRVEELKDLKCFQNSELTLLHLGIGQPEIVQEIRNAALPLSHFSKTRTSSPIYCQAHCSLTGTYCNCQVNREISFPEEFTSVYCEDCGEWFHFACVAYNS